MTKTFFSALALTLTLATPGLAQNTEVNADVANSLKMAITMNGFACDHVVFVEPMGNDGARVTCQKTAGNDATGVYIFAVSDTGLQVSEE